MAAAIPRVFWIDGARVEAGVLGDIGVLPAVRGGGRGKLLLDFLTREIVRQHGARLNFVIPTEAARRTLASIGWRTAGSLVPHVLPLDLASKAQVVVRSPAVARGIAGLHRTLLSAWLAARSARDHSLEESTEFDIEFDEFWAAFPKRGLCLGERTARTLRWRYSEHPERRFEVLKFRMAGRMCGYVISAREGAEIVVYDLLAVPQSGLGAWLASFVRRQLATGAAAIRVLLSDAHPCRRALTGLGFVPRESTSVFQLQGAATPPGARWALTQGDKDI
jgi:hypothetical protein